MTFTLCMAGQSQSPGSLVWQVPDDPSLKPYPTRTPLLTFDAVKGQ